MTKRRIPLKWLGLLVFILFSAAAGSVVWRDFQTFWYWTLSQPVEVEILKGWGPKRIARELERRGAVSSAYWFLALERVREGGFLQAGEYRFSAGESPEQILTHLRRGDVASHRIVIPEGLNADQIAQLMIRSGWTEAETLMRDPNLPQSLGVPVDSIEGWLFPDTYFFRKGEGAQAILRRMTERARTILDDEWSRRPDGFALDAYQTLVLASVIEKETGLARERPLIAAVFHNRLRINMRLQSDPTVIYGIADFSGNLTRTHLRTPTPFNTYTRKGLPPTPICNPGRAAIHAALHPVESKDLYFVARGDGGHVFSKTYREHRRHVNHYQRRRRAKP